MTGGKKGYCVLLLDLYCINRIKILLSESEWLRWKRRQVTLPVLHYAKANIVTASKFDVDESYIWLLREEEEKLKKSFILEMAIQWKHLWFHIVFKNIPCMMGNTLFSSKILEKLCALQMSKYSSINFDYRFIVMKKKKQVIKNSWDISIFFLIMRIRIINLKLQNIHICTS